jgi:trans-aconitate 2-methyltransferase
MSWNPEIYNKFKTERSAPFYDLLSLIHVKPDMTVIDLGCGTGELTRKLADFLPGADVLGVDSTPQMLKDSPAFENHQLKFECRTIEEQVSRGRKFDLAFSNAAIQWVNNHEMLLPAIISIIREGGQLLIQVPSQQHNITNKLLKDAADQEPFRNAFKNWKRISPVLPIDEYAKILFESRCESMNVFEKIYPLVLQDAHAVFDWVSGTALIPYLENLPQDLQQGFISILKKSLVSHFPGSPIFYPFKRIIMQASW